MARAVPKPPHDNHRPFPEDYRRAAVTEQGRAKTVIYGRNVGANERIKRGVEAPYEFEDADREPVSGPIDAWEARRHQANGGVPRTPNLKLPGMPVGGNAALRPEDFDGIRAGAARAPRAGRLVDAEEAGRIGRQQGARRAPDPREASPMFRFLTPKQEYVQSLENQGRGVRLPTICRRWQMGRADAWTQYRDGNWEEKRRIFLERLHRAMDDSAVANYADLHQRLESDWHKMLLSMRGRIVRKLQADLARAIDTKDDLSFARLMDVINRLERRNLGLPETSHEVRGREQFVAEVIGRVQSVLLKYLREEGVLAAIGDEFELLLTEFRGSAGPLPAPAGPVGGGEDDG